MKITAVVEFSSVQFSSTLLLLVSPVRRTTMAETSTPCNNDLNTDQDEAAAVLGNQESSETAADLQYFIQRSEFDDGVNKWKEVGVIIS